MYCAAYMKIRFKRTINFGIALLALGGCARDPDWNKPFKDAAEAADYACRIYHFTPGTEAYAKCVQNVIDARRGK
jgi:hypothetical protein